MLLETLRVQRKTILALSDQYGARHIRIFGSVAKRGAALEGHYIELLRALGTHKGMLGQIFTKAQNKIRCAGSTQRSELRLCAGQWTKASPTSIICPNPMGWPSWGRARRGDVSVPKITTARRRFDPARSEA
jgi:hypothetical protein